MFNNSEFPQAPYQGYSNPYFNAFYPPNQVPFMYNNNYNEHFQRNYDYSTNFPYNVNSDDILIIKQKREEEERNLENFLQEVEQSGELSDHKKEKKPSKIAKTRQTLLDIHKLNNELKSYHAELENNIDLSEEQWKERIEDCNKLKSKILELMTVMKDPNFLNELKRGIEKRKKRRQREKVKRQKWRNEKSHYAERRARLHAEADAWIRSKQAAIDREKQEENLRKEADMVLADVRGKKNDARKYLGVLNELKNLRNIKINIARARGEHLSLAADEAFNNIIAKLTEQWTILDREYSLEEQGLKLMLKSDNEKRIEKQKKNLFDDWENTLFGRKLLSNQTQGDLHSFVMIRAAWDKYITCDKDATTIPIGWIVPEKPSSAAWQKYLKNAIS